MNDASRAGRQDEARTILSNAVQLSHSPSSRFSTTVSRWYFSASFLPCSISTHDRIGSETTSITPISPKPYRI